MDSANLPVPGQEPGLRFATVLDGRGGARALAWSGIADWQAADGPIWLHLERDHPTAQAWLRDRSGIDPVLVEALIDEETRPRVETVGDGLLLVLRGICCLADDTQSEFGLGVDFVPVHLWVDSSRLISLRDSDHALHALRDLRAALALGRGPLRIGELLIGIADKVVKDLEPVLDQIEDEVDHLEEALIEGQPGTVRRHLAPLRRRAIHLRRYLAPQRDALRRLQEEDPTWLTPRDRILLRDVFDKVLRHLEQLDAVRDRATILHEELSSLVHERIARNSNRLAAIAALLLPPSTVAAMFGMNLGGIPGSDHPWGFVMVCLVMVGITLGISAFLRRMHWM